jgi:methyl-accepting chemotaxis protein
MQAAPDNPTTEAGRPRQPLARRLACALRPSLSIRLPVLFAIVAVVPLTIVAVVSYVMGSGALQAEALALVRQQATSNADRLIDFESRYFDDLVALRGAPALQAVIRAADAEGRDPISGATSGEAIDRLTGTFTALSLAGARYQQIRYLNQDGMEVARVDNRFGGLDVVSRTDRLQDKSDKEYFSSTVDLDSGEVFISELNLNREHGEVEVPYVPVFRLSTPVFNRLGQHRGALVLNAYADQLLDILDAGDGEIYMAGERGEYIRHPDPAMEFGADLGTGSVLQIDFPRLVEELADGEVSTMTLIDDERGEAMAVQKVRFDPGNRDRFWIVVDTIPKAEILGPARTLGIVTIGLVAATTLVVIALAIWLARDICRPISRLVNALEAMSSGDLTQGFEVNSRDELQEMAESYRATQLGLGNLVDSAKHTSGSLLTTSNDLTGILLHINDASRQVSAASLDLAKGAADQAENLAEAVGHNTQVVDSVRAVSEGASVQAVAIARAQETVGAMVSSIDSVHESARSIADASESAELAAQAGKATVERTVRRMEAINQAATEMAERVRALGEGSHYIGTIVEVIRDLTDQANQLALEAATEAAKAGEHGQGFMVVANEVRKLAERTGHATNEIIGAVSTVRRGTAEAVIGLESGAREIALGTEVAAEIGESLSAIGRAIERTAERIVAIQGTTDVLAADGQTVQSTMTDILFVAESNAGIADNAQTQAESVNRNMDSIASMTEQTSAASEQNSASSDDLNGQVEGLADSARDLAELAQQLEQEVGRFRTAEVDHPDEAEAEAG